MANTHRDKLNHKRRARWRGWVPTWDLPPAGDPFDYSDPINRYPRLRGGNMVMSPSVCGIWWDDRPQGGEDRRRQRRAVKRGERQAWQRDVAAELAADPYTLTESDHANALALDAYFEREAAKWDEWFEREFIEREFTDF